MKAKAKLGDVRADGAVCVRIEWICRSTSRGEYLASDLNDPIQRRTSLRREATRFNAGQWRLHAGIDLAESARQSGDWVVVRLITWRLPKVTKEERALLRAAREYQRERDGKLSVASLVIIDALIDAIKAAYGKKAAES